MNNILKWDCFWPFKTFHPKLYLNVSYASYYPKLKLKSPMSQPRIITGIAKGKKLLVPGTARPITDRIKHSVFDLLGEERITGASVLDLYAGSGNMGIECLSRGADSLILVDASQESIEVIKKNVLSTGFGNQAKVIKLPSRQYINQAIASDTKFDLIFIDPPFPKKQEYNLENLSEILNPNGLVILRKPTGLKVIYPNLESVYLQKYGESEVEFFG
jgi:16S rRNA (guanine966-N2)-methyltransferase